MNEQQIKYLLKRTCGRVKFRNMQKTMEKQSRGRGLRKPQRIIRFKCFFCLGKKADDQVCKSFGRKGNKVVSVGWAWICDNCIADLKNFINNNKGGANDEN